MASPEKMFKLLLDEIHQDTAPLSTIMQNQDIMIIQNKQIIALLEQVRISATQDED